jgi:hypothetical protein
MLYVIFSDRLANNLFQFSTALSITNDLVICVPHEDEYKETIKYANLFYKGFPIINYVPKDIPVYKEPHFHYKRIPYKEGSDLVITGYFQSYKYLNRIKILNQFAINKYVFDFIQNHYPCIITDRYTSIQVRRGDYMNMLYKHPFCGLKYYQKAIAIIGENEKFVIVSDDINWCKKYLRPRNAIYVENTSPIIDLYIQSICENNIISNSSFGWWGAFLNKTDKKKVIVPGLWFGFKNIQNLSDLFMPNFIIIRNSYTLVNYVKAWLQLFQNKINYIKNHLLF